MGLFDKLKKKNQDEKAQEREAKEKETKEKEETGQEDVPPSAGWESITEAFEKIYPGQTDPKHYGTLLKWRFGGKDPLDGISIYDGGDYWHFVTYGMSELYEKESENKEISGYGMEFTFKLKKGGYQDEEGEIRCICGILQTIARLTYTQGEIFRAGEYLYTGQTQGIDAYAKSNITGFITVSDQNVMPIDTPNGRVEFVEFIGATDAELKAVMDQKITVAELYEKLGTDVTSYVRDSVC